MAGLTEADLLGRRIERIFVSAPLSLLTSQKLYTVGNSPWIAASQKEYIAYVRLQPTPGSTNAATKCGFGTESSTAGDGISWMANLVNIQGYVELYTTGAMLQPNYLTSLRPGPYTTGTEFWFNPDPANPFLAGAMGVFTLYGWPW